MPLKKTLTATTPPEDGAADYVCEHGFWSSTCGESHAPSRVKIVRISEEFYHYAPIGAVGTVISDENLATTDTLQVDFDGPLVSTSGRTHPDGFVQHVLVADLEEVW